MSSMDLVLYSSDEEVEEQVKEKSWSRVCLEDNSLSRLLEETGICRQFQDL